MRHLVGGAVPAVQAMYAPPRRRRWATMERDERNERNELDEGVGRTTRLAFGHKKIVSYAPFHRRNPTSPTLLVHYCELLAAA